MTKERTAVDAIYGMSAFRLSVRGWAVVAACCLVSFSVVTPLWRAIEHGPTGGDYRIPYGLSNDYWLFTWHLKSSGILASPQIGKAIEASHGKEGAPRADNPQTDGPMGVVDEGSASKGAAVVPCYVIGDSVVWGEYVQADGTLSHFLNRRLDQQGESRYRYVNAGLNGLFPLALEGLVAHHLPSMHHAEVLLHCNLLWMSSVEADMSGTKEQTMNHVPLVAQFRPKIPCYRANFNDRLGIVIRRQFDVFGWVKHVQQCYFDQQDIPTWTLASNGMSPPSYPNVARWPFSQIRLTVPSEPTHDPLRGTEAVRHQPWYDNGIKATAFEWVAPDASLQWPAFQRLTLALTRRSNRVRVIVGPFNEHIVREAGRRGLETWKETVQNWCHAQGVSCQVPQTLPSRLYADASHPLTEGYEVLASAIQLD